MGAVTQANMRISAVDGTAFIDFSAANVLTDYLNHLLVVKDSAGRVIQGYIKAAGTGEAYGSNKISNGNMETGDPPTGWTPSGSRVTPSRVEDERTGGVGTYSLNSVPLVDLANLSIYQRADIATVLGELNLISGWGKNIDTTSYNIYSWNSVNSWIGPVVTSTSWTRSSSYHTAEEINPYVRIGLTGLIGQSVRHDDISYVKVLTPSATGVTITSGGGGTTYNWAYKESGFNYNDSSGYTYWLVSTQSQMFLHPVLQI